MSSTPLEREQTSSTMTADSRRRSPPAPAPPQPAHRDAMGEYVPAPGDGPLTCLGRPTPGPADYLLPLDTVTKPTPPSFLMTRREDRSPKVEPTPGPATYRPCDVPKCKNKLLTTLKARIEPPDYRCSPGPKYLPTAGSIPTAGSPAASLKSRPQLTAGVGLGSWPLPGGSAPAPLYDPVTSHLPAAPGCLLGAPHADTSRTAGPGAGVVNVRSSAAGPRHSLQRRPPFVLTPVSETPGPGTYDPVPVTVSCHAPLVAGRLAPPPSPTASNPAPNAYKVPKRPPGRQASLTFRSFEPEHAFHTPPATAYDVTMPDSRRAPAYSLSGALPRRPEPASAGPAASNLRQPPASRPAFFFTGRPRQHCDITPGPNVYLPQPPTTTRRGLPLTGLQPVRRPPVGPAPNAYLPRAPLPRAPDYSLTGRRRGPAEDAAGPSPADYSVGDGCLCAGTDIRPGVTMKGRQSQYVYNGFDRARQNGCMAGNAERTRQLIG